MQYFRAYKFAFEHPKWMTNLLLGGICMLIPALGPIVLMGWLYEVIEAIHRRGEQSYPDFDFGKFVPYLSRGVWPFLVQLVIGLFIMPIVIAFMIAFFAVMAGSKGQPDTGLIIALYAGFWVLMILFSLVLSLVSVPASLRAGLMMEFKAAFSMAFLWDWMKKMWLETLLVQLFLMVTAIALTFVGLVMCCVGVYPMNALVAMAQAHLHEQLYTLYLQRGGMAIPLKEPVPTEPV